MFKFTIKFTLTYTSVSTGGHNFGTFYGRKLKFGMLLILL